MYDTGCGHHSIVWLESLKLRQDEFWRNLGAGHEIQLGGHCSVQYLWTKGQQKLRDA